MLSFFALSISLVYVFLDGVAVLMSVDEFAELIASSFLVKKNRDFTGFGVVITNEEFNNLPISSLLYESNTYFSIGSMETLMDFLFKVSKFSDCRHDGFHVYDPEKKLIAVSQYFSPPINNEIKGIIYNVGARVRTAQYGSLCQGVMAVITAGKSGDIYLVVKGQAHKVESK